MDREIAPEVRKRQLVRRVAVAVVSIAAAGFVLAGTVAWMRPSVRRQNLQFATVERGTVDETLQASGTVVPLIEQVVSSPVEARVVRIGRRAGDRVRVGDELLTLDTAATRLDVARLGERVSQKESETAELRLRLEETIATLRAQIEQKKLDVEILHYTAEQKEKLRAAGLTAQQEALAAAASAKKSDIELRQLQEALTRSLHSRDAQLASAQMDLSIARREREESERQLDLAMLRAGRDGVLTWVINEEGATVKRGEVLARVADLSAFRVVATISDIHAARLAAGQRVRLDLDDTTLAAGTIDNVDPRIDNGMARFSVTLDDRANPKLRNNLRIDVHVIRGSHAGAIRVRRGALGQGLTEGVFVVSGDRIVRRTVRYGLTGDDYVEIVDGLHPGDEVVISNMNDYAGVNELRLD
ncbi:MAG: HlyD family secretion protein [Acidobacteriota bacterium]|jgi:HlyD family secretion protein|nr:HlyD family secretion protein [Acidobacteriota bacterium]